MTVKFEVAPNLRPESPTVFIIKSYVINSRHN